MPTDPESTRQPAPRLFEGRVETGELPPIVRDPSESIVRPKQFKPLRFGLKMVAFVIVGYFFILPLIPGFRDAATQLTKVRPDLLIVGAVLQISSWASYSQLTRAALGPAASHLSRMRLFRIQMSTKALTNIVPAGSAAGSALGYRLLTLSGVRGADAGFALATAGIGSAVVLNLIFWCGLLISIPIRGVNPVYATAALIGVVLMLLVAGLVLGVMHGQGRAERVIGWLAAKLRFNGDKATAAVRQIGTRVEDLTKDRNLLKQVVLWSLLQWTLDMASLWVFLRAFHGTLAPDALIVVFGLASIMQVIPLTPGGLGIVEGIYIPTLVAFELSRRNAVLGVASYRMAQLFLPIVVGAFFYATLRVGPWSIKRREQLQGLRTLAKEDEAGGETRVDFLMRVWPRRTQVVSPMPEVAVSDEEIAEAERADVIEQLDQVADPQQSQQPQQPPIP